MFLNIVLDEAVEEKEGGEKVRLGMVVSCFRLTLDIHRLTNSRRLFEATRSSC